MITQRVGRFARKIVCAFLSGDKSLEDHVDELSVKYAYRFLLGRDPERDDIPEKIVNRGLTVGQLRREIIESEEFRRGPKRNRYSGLFLDGDKQIRSLLLLGTCVAEGILEQAVARGWQVSHNFLDYFLNSEGSNAKNEKMDAVLVHLTLRYLLADASISLSGVRDGDLYYLRLTDNNYIEEVKNNLRKMIHEIIDKTGNTAPIFFLSFPEPPETIASLYRPRGRKSIYYIVRSLNDHMAELLANIDGVFLLEVNDMIGSIGSHSLYDVYHNSASHAGFEGAEIELIRDAIICRIDNMLKLLKNEVKPIKAIITDLDNTLWKGVLAEMDEIVPAEHIEGWPIGYAEALLICKQRGILLAICSKNNYEQTQRNFLKVWGQKLTLSDFASVYINWCPKSENIEKILGEINILPENVLFIDDNPLEVAEVMRAYPEIRTLTGDPHRWRMELIYGIPLQVVEHSDESSRRTELIQAKIEREKLLSNGNREDYLKDLEIKAEIKFVNDSSDRNLDRIIELINRTNQFNTTGKRWTKGELIKFTEVHGNVYYLRASDRFADYGIISVALMRESLLEQMVMSCRVFGLGLEDLFLSYLYDEKSESKLLYAKIVDTGRNTVAINFIDKHFVFVGQKYRLQGKPGCPEHIACLNP